MRYVYVCVASVLFVVLVLLSTEARCQEQSFFKQNRFTVASFLVLQGSDALATERNLSYVHHHECNPLMPSATQGRALYFAGTAAAVVGTAYLFHRTGHDKIARSLLWIGIGTEAQASVRSWAKI